MLTLVTSLKHKMRIYQTPHTSETHADLLEQTVTRISETQHDSTK